MVIYVKKADAGAAQHAGQGDQGQAGEGGRVGAVDAFEHGDAETFVLGAAGAVVGLFDAQVGVELVVGQVAEGDEGLDSLDLRRLGGVAAVPQAQRRMEVTRRPRIFCSWARARAWSPGLPICSPSSVATWSEPITSAPGCLRDRGRLSARARRRAVASGASPGSGVSSMCGAIASKGRPQPGQQFAPVGGAGSEDQAQGGGCGGTWYHVGQSIFISKTNR
jgi:hypothetical protein